VLQHSTGQVTGDGLDDMIRLAGFEQARHYGVSQVVKA
jgi:hypothetical protein